ELTESDDEGDSTPSARGELSTSAASSDAAESMTPTGTQVSGNRSLAASEAPRATGTSQRNNRTTIPEAGKGPKVYTVQVGAFTNPGIAQQWAQEWKARGYNVSLKPVARPRTGVIYRLYLGEFSSEKKADELVKRLRQNEGISAIRLVVRN
ncbi:MAG: SPOR domain-containing protein, partial [Deltaproteobacteria bacterium]|nr:SPOR domain-containing protein [Deltaproteobacteria bacterium]